MRTLLPSLKIHVWGGLGSQLFAIALAFQLTRKFPKREIVMVLHSGGVTKRLPEIYELFPEFVYEKIDDFSIAEGIRARTGFQTLQGFTHKLLRLAALSTGLLAEENDAVSRKVRFWTLSVRGHYFHRKVEYEFLNVLYQRLEQRFGGRNQNYSKNLILHYRLGDLLELANKSALQPSRIVQAITQNENFGEILVLSDSPGKAVSMLSKASDSLTFQTEPLASSPTLFAASQANVFLGTSSKISYWIILLRITCSNKRKNIMPYEDKIIFQKLLGGSEGIKYY